MKTDLVPPHPITCEEIKESLERSEFGIPVAYASRERIVVDAADGSDWADLRQAFECHTDADIGFCLQLCSGGCSSETQGPDEEGKYPRMLQRSYLLCLDACLAPIVLRKMQAWLLADKGLVLRWAASFPCYSHADQTRASSVTLLSDRVASALQSELRIYAALFRTQRRSHPLVRLLPGEKGDQRTDEGKGLSTHLTAKLGSGLTVGVREVMSLLDAKIATDDAVMQLLTATWRL